MKFNILKSYLLQALNTVSKAISNKNPNAILTGVKLSLTDEGLMLVGTDTDISIETFIPKKEGDEQVITTFEEGEVVVSCKYILEIVRKLDCDVIEFELMEKTLMKIRDNQSDFSLNTMSVEDFPMVDFSDVGVLIKLESTVLRDIIDQTCFATSDKETRPILTGVNFKANSSGNLECVATDSYRLSRKTLAINENVDFNVTIPSKSLQEVGKIIDTNREVELNVSAKKVIFKLKNTKISTRLISGAYPDVSKIIPTSFAYVLNCTSQSILSGIDRASLFSTDRDTHVKMTLTSDQFLLSSKSMEGSVVEKVREFNYSGDRLEITFRSRFVVEAIRAIASDDIEILLNGDKKTFIIKNKNDSSNIHLIQPVMTY